MRATALAAYVRWPFKTRCWSLLTSTHSSIEPLSPNRMGEPSMYGSFSSPDSGSSHAPWTPSHGARPSTTYSSDPSNASNSVLSPGGPSSPAAPSTSTSRAFALPLRHEDGGPVADLARSPSGRLPPAYRSWERASAAGSASGSGSQVSEPQSFGYGVGLGADAALQPRSPPPPVYPRPQSTATPREDPFVPLNPLRRSETKAEMSRGSVIRPGEAVV